MHRLGIVLMAFVMVCCSKNDSAPPPEKNFNFNSHTVNGESDPSFTYKGVSIHPQITFTFSDRIKESSIVNGVKFTEGSTTAVPFNTTLEDDNTTVVITPAAALKGFTQYKVSLSDGLLSETDKPLSLPVNVTINTGMDSTDKFPKITNDALLTLVQQQ